MIYLFLGEDRQAKEQQIAKIKASCLPSDQARNFDYELLHGAGLDPDILKKALIALPAIAPKRVVLLRNPEQLDTQSKNILLEFAKKGHAHAVLILDSDESNPKDNFFKELEVLAKVVRISGKGKKRNIWDATRAMERRDPSEALEILNELMEAGDPPVKVLGALVWFWGDCKGRLPAEKFKKGLLVLQEADLNIKRSRLLPEQAVEIAVTHLSSLIAG